MKKLLLILLCLPMIGFGQCVSGDCQDGKGTLEFNGMRYVGEFKNGNFYGFGTMTFVSGAKYVGEWKDGKYHGLGTYTDGGWSAAYGSKYVGEWKDGKKHLGTQTYVSGAKYAGEWKDDRRNGLGTYTFGLQSYAYGEKYVGEWKDGKKHGLGTYTYGAGAKYAGEWKKDRRNGLGTYTFADGEKYVGEHKDEDNSESSYVYRNDTLVPIIEPEFPGGREKFARYLQKNLRHPKLSKEDNISGKVDIEFVVEKSGSVTNVKVVRGVDKRLDDEAVRVIKSLPKFKPATERGKPIRMLITVPINFTAF